MKNSYPVNVHRACGHNEVASIRYGSAREKSSELSAAKAIFCCSCRAMVEAWMSRDSAVGPYDLTLPALAGTPRRVSWAQGLRTKLALPLLRAMTSAAEHGGPMGAAVWKSLYAVVTQRDASVWIDNRERGFCHYTIEREAGCFARGFDGLALGSTLYSQIRKSGAYRIAEIEKSCPVTLPSQSVAS